MILGCRLDGLRDVHDFYSIGATWLIRALSSRKVDVEVSVIFDLIGNG